ncbi:MAG TPA: sulfatase [Gaiellaceae bacterium]|nr:sulfatase [Gaiellaceae bacterium]
MLPTGRIVFTTLGAFLLAGAAASALGDGAQSARPVQAAPGRPLNVVLILSDDERLDGDSVMHNVQTLLARHGVTFANYHVTTSECGPSRASILLGQYAHHTGVLDNFGLASYPAFDQTSDLPVWLHGAGYDTALVGKYLNDYTLDGDDAIPPGWDDWQVMDSVPEERYYDYTLNENGRLVSYGRRPADYSTTVLTQKATSFIRHASKPFFLYFAPVTPHLPAIPAPRDRGRLENLAPFDTPSLNERSIGDKPWRFWHRRLLKAAATVYENHVREHQLESLYALDRSVGKIVTALRQRHELDRTVILYTSDNGFLYGEHRLGGKLWPYEESTHVPLVVRTPWRAANGTVDREPVLNIDLASTIAALAGVTPARPQDGYSFVPFLHGRRVPWRRAYLVEYLGRNQLRFGGPPPYVAVHTSRYLYVEYRRGWRELYDLRRDPWELHNVAASPDYARQIGTLHALLQRLEFAPPHGYTVS